MSHKKIRLFKASTILATTIALMPAQAFALDISTPTASPVSITEADPTLHILNGGNILIGYNASIISGTGALSSITVDNGGEITNTDGYHGFPLIDIDNATFSGAISNAGIISSDSRQDSKLVDISNTTVSGGIINTGAMSFDSGEGGSVLYIYNGSVINNITNEGSFSGEEGIYLSGGSKITGTINNSGTISALSYCNRCDSEDPSSYSSSYAFLITDNNTEISANINNSGTIESVKGSAIYVSSNAVISGDITNTGTIKTTDNASEATVFIRDNASVTGKITNKGTMSFDSGEGSVLALEGASMTNDFVNDVGGTITSTGFGINVYSYSQMTGKIINSGGTLSGNSAAINVDNSSDISGGIYISSGTVSSSDRAINVVTASVTGGINLSDTGTIKTVGKGYAIYLKKLTAETPINITGGRIIGDVYDDKAYIGFSDVTIGGTFTSEGNFTVSSFNINSDGDFTFGDGNTINADSNVNNEGVVRVLAEETGTFTNNFINKSGGQVFVDGTLQATSIINSLGASLIVSANKNATIESQIENNGSITINSGASLTTYAISGKGTFNIGVKDDGDNILNAADIGTLHVQMGEGTTFDLSGDAFNFNVTGTIATGSITIADFGPSVLAEGAVIPDVTDNSSKYNFALSYESNKLVATISANAGISVPAVTPNGQVIADQLQDIIDNTTPDAQLQSLLDAAMNASTPEQLEQVTDNILPANNGNIYLGSRVVANNSIDLSFNRLDALRSTDGDTLALNSSGMTGMAAGDAPLKNPGKYAWVETFGQVANQSMRQGFAGYDANTYGVIFGIDSKEIIKDITLGVAFSYGKTSVDSDNSNNTQTDSDTYQLSLYGEKELDSRTRIDGVIGYSISNTNMDIYDVGGVPGLNASGDFDGSQISSEVSISRDFYPNSGIKVTPNVLANYSHFETDHYQETGAGGASQIVDNSSMDSFELGFGVKTSALYLIGEPCGSCGCGTDWFEPSINVGVKHDFIGDKAETTSQFSGGGGSFKTYGFSPAQTTFDIGVGVKRFSIENWEVTAKYDLEFKQDYTAHNASVRFGYRF